MVDMELRRRPVHEEEKQVAMEDSHCFKTTNFKRPTWCDHCGKMIWGLYKQGESCSECGIKIHHKCHSSVPHSCGPAPKGSQFVAQ